MKPHLRLKLPFAGMAFFAVLFGIALTARGGIPALQATVFDVDQKVAFQGPLGADGSFATRSLPGQVCGSVQDKEHRSEE